MDGDETTHACFPIDDHLEDICTRVFRVETHWPGDDGQLLSRLATGFAVARLPREEFVVATAKHVLNFPEDTTVSWTVQQFDACSRYVRGVRYGTNLKLKGDVPYRTYQELDIGVFVLPDREKQSDGRSFSHQGEPPLPMMPEHFMITTGTRVGWVGFPTGVENYVGCPQVCYCEGVVSTIVNRSDKHLYIVDGHGAKGFSGGPVLTWFEDRSRFEVVGIVSEYRSYDGLPGFCCFEPINTMRSYLRSWNAQLEDGEIMFA